HAQPFARALLVAREVKARLGGLHLADAAGALLCDRQGGPLRPRFERHEDLAFLDAFAALHRDLLDQALDRATDVDHLPSLDDAVELVGPRLSGKGDHTEPKDKAADWHVQAVVGRARDSRRRSRWE